MGFIWDKDKEDDKKFTAHVTKITKSLEDSKTGLQADLKKAKKELKEKEGVNISEFNAMKTENATLKAERDSSETDAQKQLRIQKETHETEMKKLKADVALLNDSNKEHLVDNKITKALRKAKVKDSLFDAATRIIKSDVVVVDEDGKRVARIGDKSIPEYVKYWADTEEGKNFVVAKKNKGGNSNGGDNKDYKSSDYARFYDPKSKQFNVTQQLLLSKNNKDLHAKLSSKFGTSVK